MINYDRVLQALVLLTEDIDPKKVLLIRLVRVLAKHFKDEDLQLSERDFTLKCFDRYKRHLEAEIIDVGE